MTESHPQEHSPMPGRTVQGASLYLPRWGLLADDLTGACDAGVQFARQGFSSVLYLGNEDAACELEADLLIRSSNSRSDPPQVASERVLGLGERFQQENRSLLYKKIDSTLKGNLAVEICAAMKICKVSLAIVAPAFPAMGRILEDGFLRGTGGAVVQEVHLPSLLGEQGAGNVAHVGIDVLRGGVSVIDRNLRSGMSGEPRIVVFDTRTQEHLSLIAQAAMSLEERPLLVGSAGLSAEVAAILAKAYKRKVQVAPRTAGAAAAKRSVVMFIGSNNPVTLAQVEYLSSHRLVNCLSFAEGFGGLVHSAIKAQRHLVVTVGRDEDENVVAAFASRIFEMGCAGLFFSGGDTAHMICRAIDVRGIRLENEILPGVPWGKIVGGPADGLPVAMKAGGFGKKQALVAVADFLAG